MRDCSNAAMRDLLPDLLNDRLAAGERAQVHAHLNACADCRAELELLERVRASSRRIPAVDTQRIVAAVPAYRHSRWRAVSKSPLLRAAAVIIIVLGGALLLRSDDPQVADSVPHIPLDSAPTRVAADPAPAVQSEPIPATSPPRSTQAANAELAMGEMFEDLTDAELEALLRSLGSLEAVIPVETEVVPPAVNREGT